MVFLVQFWNKFELVSFQRAQIALALRGSCNFELFENSLVQNLFQIALETI